MQPALCRPIGHLLITRSGNPSKPFNYLAASMYIWQFRQFVNFVYRYFAQKCFWRNEFSKFLRHLTKPTPQSCSQKFRQTLSNCVPKLWVFSSNANNLTAGELISVSFFCSVQNLAYGTFLQERKANLWHQMNNQLVVPKEPAEFYEVLSSSFFFASEWTYVEINGVRRFIWEVFCMSCGMPMLMHPLSLSTAEAARFTYLHCITDWAVDAIYLVTRQEKILHEQGRVGRSASLPLYAARLLAALQGINIRLFHHCFLVCW